MLKYEATNDREIPDEEISLFKHVVERLKVVSHVENVVYEMALSFSRVCEADISSYSYKGVVYYSK
jgi:hypothetical protein